jgi:hypothetical protein
MNWEAYTVPKVSVGSSRNARGVESSTHVGANLHEQLSTLSLESHGFK